MKLTELITGFLADERGDVAISYAIIASAMVIAMAVYLVMMGDDMDGMMSPASDQLRTRRQ
ncbi:MAG: hypothetical protein Alpg2KO_19430 [Alphaproteobacteria bacterium]